ncbi:MAG: type III-A CRISPR-associated protein Cas10/Csm1, partial [Chloroflexaceae bacterium]
RIHMHDTPTEVALAALHYWAERAQGRAGEAVLPPTHRDLLRHAAWLVQGQPPAQQPGWPDPLDGPLRSIFSRITPRTDDPQAATPPEVYVRRSSLALDRDILFPVGDIQNARSSQGRDPVDALAEELAQLTQRALPTPAYLEGWLYTLQRHAWSLPSPLPAVSLYDFARTHAAVAAALAAQDDMQGDLYLLGGDLSGVQRFIYTLTAEGATKQLRGRSFYLQLLTDVCARSLLRAAGLPLTNLLYAGGGRFYAVLPGSIGNEPTADWLATHRQILGTFFLHQHQGELYLALGGDTLTQTALCDADRFRAAWGQATEAINHAKRRRFADLGDALVQLFAVQGHGGQEQDACAVCGYQGQAREFVRMADDPRGRRRCVLCESFEDLGRLLHNAEYLLLHHLTESSLQTESRRQPWQRTLAHLGIHVQLRGPHARSGDHGNAPVPADRSVTWTTVLALDDAAQSRDDHAVLPLVAHDTPWVRGYRPMANTTPTMRQDDLKDWKPQHDDERPPRINDVKPFQVMVAQSTGVKRLGVLRMDVDDLGDLFRYRLDSGLARVSALSAALGLFFEGWVGTLCEATNTHAESRGSVYCIYSGGDDLFIVGSWHRLLPLAHQISTDLTAFAGHNPTVHVSAGISLHGAKFPLYQAADASEGELKRAKSRPGKAALGWLDQVIAWTYVPADDGLFRLKTDVTRTDMPRALLQTLQQLFLQYGTTLRDGKLFYGPWLWRGAYQLKRAERTLPADAA